MLKICCHVGSLRNFGNCPDDWEIIIFYTWNETKKTARVVPEVHKQVNKLHLFSRSAEQSSHVQINLSVFQHAWIPSRRWQY